MTTLILVRHGQTEWNQPERFRGHVDVPLNNVGLAQAEATGLRIANQWRPSAVFSSPLSRTVKTAEAIAKHFELPVNPRPSLIDINHGDWQGLTPNEVHQRWPDNLAAWYNTPHLAYMPGGETLDQVRSRALPAVREIVAQHPTDTVVIVGHAVLNRVILLGIMGLGNDWLWRLEQDTCSINVVELDGKFFILKSLNDTSHLRHLLAA